MAETVHWREDGLPASPRFGDIHHGESGAVAQARHVFLGGCGLPAAWAGRAQWRILETGFGFGLSFLTTWQAWRDDPSRPQRLHFVSVEAFPVAREDLLRAATACPELAHLAAELAQQWHGLLPGVHRLCFDGGRVLLTLAVGEVQRMLRALAPFEADSLYLDGFSPQANPDMWSRPTLQGLTRFARRGSRLATWTIARPLRDALVPLGWQVAEAPGLPPEREGLQALYEPAWTLRRERGGQALQAAPTAPAPASCLVIGAGLAGAATAAALARRGWQVQVLEAADTPAAGASALPVALMAPHVSPDDALLSQLTRAGIRATWQQLAQHLAEGQDWGATGALERTDAPPRLPSGWSAQGPNESWPADAERLRRAGLADDTPALWNARAAWVRPHRLVAAWLATPGVTLRTGACVVALERGADGVWQALDAAGRPLAQAQRVVVAAAFESRPFAPALPLRAVRGQVAFGVDEADPADHWPCVPVNGDGHLIAGVPADGGWLWLSGSTFDRGDTATDLRDADTAANLERVARLHPGAGARAAQREHAGAVQAWAGVRCTSSDRRPMVGPVQPDAPDGPWIVAGLGSRGLSFAALAAELLAARWHGEPLPVSARLADALATERFF